MATLGHHTSMRQPLATLNRSGTVSVEQEALKIISRGADITLKKLAYEWPVI